VTGEITAGRKRETRCRQENAAQDSPAVRRIPNHGRALGVYLENRKREAQVDIERELI
jgi:hypothetical protein